MSGLGRGAQDPFVGRGVELRRLREWRAGGGRLLTMRGAPGVGKSRLAWEFARELGDAVLVLDMQGDLDPAARLARALGVAPAGLSAALCERGAVVLVLDDLDPVSPEARRAIAAWLEGAPQLAVLVTSREALHVPGEVPMELGPLAIADEAVELLRLRAASAGADLSEACPAAVRKIAAALDGLPLALELAAVQLAHLPVDQLLERLPARLELLVRQPGTIAFARFGSLREAIEASWGLLSANERRALAQASVFHGGFDLESAAAVLAIDGEAQSEAIRSLLDRSLIQKREPAGERFAIDESIRVFAARHLDPAERVAAERRHAAWFLGRADGWAEAIEARTDLAAIAALERDQENLLEIHRRCLARTHVSAEAAAEALLAAVQLAPLLMLRQQDSRALGLLDAALATSSPARTEPGLRARALLARGTARIRAGRPASALADLLEAIGLARGARDALLEGRVLLSLSRAHREQGRDEESRRTCERAIELFRQRNADEWLGRALGTMGMLAHERGELEGARAWFEQAVEANLRCGDRRAGAVSRGTLGNVLLDLGRKAEALEAIRAAIAVFHELGDVGNEGALLTSVALIHQEAGDWGRACLEYERGLALARLGGRRRLEGLALSGLAGALFEAGRFDEALSTFEASVATFRELGDTRNIGLTLLPLGMLLAAQGRLAEAEAQIDEAERMLREVDDAGRAASVAAARGAVELARARNLRMRGAGDDAALLEERAVQLLETARSGPAARREGERLLVRLLAGALAQNRRRAG